MYRQPDHSALETFASHLSIAETMLGVHRDLLARLWREPDLRDSYLKSWGELWEQLDEARAIVGRLERDGRAYDVERQRAGDPYLAAAGLVAVTPAMREATQAAIAALRACAPEIVVPEPDPRPAPVLQPWVMSTFWLTVLVVALRCCAAMSH